MGKFDSLIAAAGERGARDAVLINARDDIVIEKRANLLCQFGCGEYGRQLTCPPKAPRAEEFAAEYEHALLMTFSCPANLSLEKSRCLMSLSAGKKDAEVEKFWQAWDPWKRSLYEKLLELERAAFGLGLPFSLAFGVGSCPWCKECVDSYTECRFPSKRRGSVEAVGINVVATCARAGIELTFPVAGHPKVVSMLFLG
jgi:predicted metal-binding protein